MSLRHEYFCLNVIFNSSDMTRAQQSRHSIYWARCWSSGYTGVNKYGLLYELTQFLSSGYISCSCKPKACWLPVTMWNLIRRISPWQAMSMCQSQTQSHSSCHWNLIILLLPASWDIFRCPRWKRQPLQGWKCGAGETWETREALLCLLNWHRQWFQARGVISKWLQSQATYLRGSNRLKWNKIHFPMETGFSLCAQLCTQTRWYPYASSLCLMVPCSVWAEL